MPVERREKILLNCTICLVTGMLCYFFVPVACAADIPSEYTKKSEPVIIQVTDGFTVTVDPESGYISANGWSVPASQEGTLTVAYLSEPSSFSVGLLGAEPTDYSWSLLSAGSDSSSAALSFYKAFLGESSADATALFAISRSEGRASLANLAALTGACTPSNPSNTTAISSSYSPFVLNTGFSGASTGTYRQTSAINSQLKAGQGGPGIAVGESKVNAGKIAEPEVKTSTKTDIGSFLSKAERTPASEWDMVEPDMNPDAGKDVNSTRLNSLFLKVRTASKETGAPERKDSEESEEHQQGSYEGSDKSNRTGQQGSGSLNARKGRINKSKIMPILKQVIVPPDRIEANDTVDTVIERWIQEAAIPIKVDGEPSKPARKVQNAQSNNDALTLTVKQDFAPGPITLVTGFVDFVRPINDNVIKNGLSPPCSGLSHSFPPAAHPHSRLSCPFCLFSRGQADFVPASDCLLFHTNPHSKPVFHTGFSSFYSLHNMVCSIQGTLQKGVNCHV